MNTLFRFVKILFLRILITILPETSPRRDVFEIILIKENIFYFCKPIKNRSLDFFEKTKRKVKRFFSILFQTATLTLKELKKIIIDFLLLDIWGCLKKTGSDIWNILKKVKDLRKEDIKNMIQSLKNTPQKIKILYQQLIVKFKLASIKEILLFSFKLIIFSSSVFLGYKIPDLDIHFLGIGNHRNWFTHSIIPMVFISLLGKLVQRFINHMKQKCNQDDESIRKLLEEINGFINIAVSGGMIGISWHLFKDVFIDGYKSIQGPWPREWIPKILRTRPFYIFDNGYLLSNAVMGFRQGTHSFYSNL